MTTTLSSGFPDLLSYSLFIQIELRVVIPLVMFIRLIGWTPVPESVSWTRPRLPFGITSALYCHEIQSADNSSRQRVEKQLVLGKEPAGVVYRPNAIRQAHYGGGDGRFLSVRGALWGGGVVSLPLSFHSP